MSFKHKLNRLFEEALDVNDTIWYSTSETLFAAILRIYEEDKKEEKEK